MVLHIYRTCKISRNRIPNSLCSVCAKALKRGQRSETREEKTNPTGLHQENHREELLQNFQSRPFIDKHPGRRGYDNDDNDACICIYIYPQDLPRQICIHIYISVYTTVNKTFWFLAVLENTWTGAGNCSSSLRWSLKRYFLFKDFPREKCFQTRSNYRRLL